MTARDWTQNVRIPDGRTGIVISRDGDDATVRLDDGGELVSVIAAELDVVTWP
jgi:hypothetical protein